MTVPLTRGLGLDEVPGAVDASLDAFLAGKCRGGTAANPHLPRFVALLRDFLAGGGKRLRPVLCCSGWQAAGPADPAPVLSAAASLELFHAFALIHDDVMDGSETRRGRPTVHRRLAARVVRPRAGADGAERFGAGAAILLGDLAMVWSEELFHTSGLPTARLAAARPVLDAMRSEVMYGQYLDLLAGSRPYEEDGAQGEEGEQQEEGEQEEGAPGPAARSGGLEAALTVVRYKTAKYTVERPLQLGAALAGADEAALSACSAYGVPLGEAFQLRDDVLGVFGDPAVTGKSRLDDLRENKWTALLALAFDRADPVQARTLRTLVGDPLLDEEGAGHVREVLRGTGALDTVEEMIAERHRQAVDSLAGSPLPPGVRDTLHELATAATVRTA